MTESSRRWLIAGSAASLASTLVLTACGWSENRRPAGPSNGPSQWVWGRQASHRRRFSVMHTVIGYGVHHVCSLFWAGVHTAVFPRPATSLQQELLRGASTAGLACAVDYRVAQGRLQPGFERQLSRTSLLLTYAAFGLALGAARHALSRR